MLPFDVRYVCPVLSEDEKLSVYYHAEKNFSRQRKKSMRVFVFVSAMLFTLLFSCTLQYAQVPRLYFRRVENKKALQWASQWQADQHGLALRLDGYGIWTS
jgi:hypothetical protein